MNRTNRAPRALADAATVHAAREEIVQALGPLAASPLNEDAAGRMRIALERMETPAVRDAVRRMARPEDARPSLLVVTTPDGTRGDLRTPAPSAHFNQPLYAIPGGDAA